jgi:hypothetical protein
MWVSEPDSILRGNGKVFEKDEHEVSDDVEVIPTGVSDDVEVVPTGVSDDVEVVPTTLS